jgi:hypothetical protein
MTSHRHDRGVACVSVARVSGSAATHASDELSVEERREPRLAGILKRSLRRLAVAVSLA